MNKKERIIVFNKVITSIS